MEQIWKGIEQSIVIYNYKNFTSVSVQSQQNLTVSVK